jgi:MarR family transcriptional regulator for hemolysin
MQRMVSVYGRKGMMNTISKSPAVKRLLRQSPRYVDFYEPGTRLEREFRAMLAVMATTRNWVRVLEGRIKHQTGQSRVRWEMLLAISFADGPTTASAIAPRVGTQWPSLVRVLDSLEEDGLILRRGNPSDGRSRLIELTPEGEELTARVRNTIDPARTELLDFLSDEELSRFLEVAERIQMRLVEELS